MGSIVAPCSTVICPLRSWISNSDENNSVYLGVSPSMSVAVTGLPTLSPASAALATSSSTGPVENSGASLTGVTTTITVAVALWVPSVIR